MAARTWPRLLLLALLAAAWSSSPAQARVLRDLDFQTKGLLGRDGHPRQWDNYVPGDAGTSGISLGSPGRLPFPYVVAARFRPINATGRPRAMAKLSKHSVADPGVRLVGPLDSAEGLDRYYRFYTYFPKDFDLPVAPIGAPAIFTAWHGDASRGSGCIPPVQFHVKRQGLGAQALHVLVRIQGGRHSKTPPTNFRPEGGNPNACFTETYKEIDLGPLVRGRWIRWGLHIKWSSHTDGFVDVRRDGHRTLIPGANLYSWPNGPPETGFLEQGYYSPADTSEAARRRSIWMTGTVVGDAPRDMAPPFGCRRLPGRAQHFSLQGKRFAVSVSRRADSNTPAVVRIRGPLGLLRRAVARTAGHRYPVHHGRARISVRRFGPLGPKQVLVRIVPRSGAARTLRIRLQVRQCKTGKGKPRAAVAAPQAPQPASAPAPSVPQPRVRWTQFVLPKLAEMAQRRLAWLA